MSAATNRSAFLRQLVGAGVPALDAHRLVDSYRRNAGRAARGHISVRAAAASNKALLRRVLDARPSRQAVAA